ncbi:Gram-positive pilin backbone subunit 2, Cna-B-like domain-containing protein [Bifidobacterium sp. DSM 109958]|uniref:Gram-positive pilin backbone subunit 2, Cna-B-like domain-containing protein n=1 Tax=Bifidobacterium moraviense TaxID=2675323 RepID=A0A7Y0F4S1_9BIFI|nr:SpaH/EbpB family LPXTG-anchored major pilin [Bifidobacterium sp. DSM 109958]NMN01067.1 Gram-positive pilin backbone subunit 2, Cna-B-like domain-containing protein [Bifidobacterium sp. DSM 109958]
MKKLSKALLGLIAAVAMLFTGLATGTAAVADTGGQTNNTYSITIKNGTEGYTYEAYQVFKGDLSDSTLSNIQWGDGVNGTELLAALKDDETLKDTFKNAKDAADVAAKLSSDNVQKFAEIVSDHVTAAQSSVDSPTNGKYVISNLAAGYYLVKNTKVPTGVDAAYSKLIIKVTDNVEAESKMDKPKVTKKVKDVNDSTGAVSDWQDTADHDINDWIDYKLDGTLPADYDAYNTYSYTFTDTLSEGLTYDGNNESHKVKVYVVNKGADGKEVETAITDGYTVDAVKDDDGKLGAPYENGTTLTVAFADLKSATVDGGVKITKDSIIRVTYQAQLNDHAKVGSTGNPNEVTLTYSNNPTKEGTGTTAPDKVTVFTFTLNVNKYVDSVSNKKPGAKFTLSKLKDGNWTEVKKYDSGTETTFEFKRLDDGCYKLVEDAAPAGYNRMADLYFTVAATHTVDQENDGGNLELKSLTITVTDASGTELTSTDIQKFTTDMTSATVNISTDIINHKGSTLPSTGGMGTVILYAAGGMCLLAAGLWFGLRRRTAR